MKLDEKKNFIVSGIERSGTSLLMQILKAGGIPIASDDKRLPDENNPKGYYELEGGKIINILMDGTFPFDRYKGQFIKITAYGLTFLPAGAYHIIYSERNLEEILDSMEKMAKINDDFREETKESFRKLNEMIKKKISLRDDCKVLFVNYNELLSNPEEPIKAICIFLGIPKTSLSDMIAVVDHRLYRQKRTK